MYGRGTEFPALFSLMVLHFVCSICFPLTSAASWIRSRRSSFFVLIPGCKIICKRNVSVPPFPSGIVSRSNPVSSGFRRQRRCFREKHFCFLRLLSFAERWGLPSPSRKGLPRCDPQYSLLPAVWSTSPLLLLASSVCLCSSNKCYYKIVCTLKTVPAVLWSLKKRRHQSCVFLKIVYSWVFSNKFLNFKNHRGASKKRKIVRNLHMWNIYFIFLTLGKDVNHASNLIQWLPLRIYDNNVYRKLLQALKMIVKC